MFQTKKTTTYYSVALSSFKETNTDSRKEIFFIAKTENSWLEFDKQETAATSTKLLQLKQIFEN